MPVNIEDRPIEKVREETIEVLIFNYSHSHINEEGFEKRLDLVMASHDKEKITAQIADLELPPSGATQHFNTPELGIQYSTEPTADAENIICIFAGSDRQGPWLVPSKIKSLILFGGAKIDLSQATFTSKTINLKVFCMFGGVDINVPEGVRVSSSTACIFGGINNKVRSEPDYNGPILRIEGLVIFGGIKVKIKQTIKEKFVAFANQMKNMFDSTTSSKPN